MPEAPARAFLSAEWRYLVMLNYEIDPRVLEPLVPIGTVLDLWQGRALVSVVGFRFLGTRVMGLGIPFHRRFDEVNLRLYVRRHVSDGDVRRGVVFVREFVPRVAIAFCARLTYNEPYTAVSMRSAVPEHLVEMPGRLTYEWRVGATWQRLAATAAGPPAVPPAGSEAAFITEHYWGYTRQRDGGTIEYQVTHPAWRVWAGTDAMLAADIAALYGTPFVRALCGPPTSSFIAEGSPVVVRSPSRLTGSRAR